MRKPTFCIFETKGADQLCGNRAADQRLCFQCIDSTIPLLPKFKISSLNPCSVVDSPLYSLVCFSLVGNPKVRFSYQMAHLINVLICDR